jgi:hypothetical protein
VTAVVVREGEIWTVSSWIDAPLESSDEFQTLDELVRTADVLVGDSYPAEPTRQSAELQYSIYPWSGKGDIAAILDITGEPGAFVANDIQGSGLDVRGPTAETLVVEAASRFDDPSTVMFTWIKQIAQLRSDPGAQQ